MDRDGWILKCSGRWLSIPKRAASGLFLEMAFASEFWVPVVDASQDDTERIAPRSGDDEPLTDDERREIADAVIAAWNRWAEVGEPALSPGGDADG